MTETTISITRDCALVVTHYDPTIAPDVAIQYNKHSPAYRFSNELTDADIGADTARAMIAALVEAFGPAVLPGAGGEE